MTMGVRIGGLLLLCYLGLLLAVDGGWRTIVARRPVLLLEVAWTAFLRVLLPVLLFAYPVMLVFWPWGQTDPIENPLRALAFFSHQNFPFSTLFAGRFVPASNLPWTYLPTHIALALPELILALLLTGPILGGVVLARGETRISRKQVLVCLILGVGIVFPVAFAIAVKAVLFDGMRHFIFVLPLAAVASALVASQGLTRVMRYQYRKPIYAVIALYSIAHISVMAMLHPDQYVYYNSFVGGGTGAGLTPRISRSGSSLWRYAARRSRLITTFRRTFASRASSLGQIFLSRLPRIIVTVRCRANQSSESSVWARCCRLCSTGLTASPRSGPQGGRWPPCCQEFHQAQTSHNP